MSKEQLLEKLRRLEELSESDKERAHIYADEALLKYINDPDISEAFDHIGKWYS